jgi:hypothetical protein
MNSLHSVLYFILSSVSVPQAYIHPFLRCWEMLYKKDDMVWVQFISKTHAETHSPLESQVFGFLSSRPAWSIERVPGQSGLYRKTLSRKKKKKKKTKKIKGSQQVYTDNSQFDPVLLCVPSSTMMPVLLGAPPTESITRRVSMHSLWPFLLVATGIRKGTDRYVTQSPVMTQIWTKTLSELSEHLM